MTAKRALVLCAVVWFVLLVVTSYIVAVFHVAWWAALLFTMVRVVPVVAFVAIYLGWYRNPRR